MDHIKSAQNTKCKSACWLRKDVLLRICSYSCVFLIALSMVLGGIQIASGETGSASKSSAANSKEALAAYAYINDHLKKGEIVLFFKPRVLYLYTDVLSYTNDTDLPETIRDADYLLNYAGNHRFDKYINNHKESLIQQYKNEQFILYKIDKQRDEGNIQK